MIRFNQAFDKTQEARNINQNIGYEPQPNFLHESGDWVYLNNPETGVLVFDIFGTYFKTIPLKGLKDFQIAGDNLLYFNDGKLQSYNLKTLQQAEVEIPADEIQMLRVEKEKLMILTKESLKVYEVK